MKTPANLRRSIFSGSFWGAAQSGIRMAIAVFSVPLTIGYLGRERYGLWMTALSLLSFVSFLDMGLFPTLLNRMAGAHARGDAAAFRAYSAAGLRIGAILCAAGAFISFGACAIPWADLLNVSDPQARREAGPLVCLLMGLSFAILGAAVLDHIYAARMEIATPKAWGTAASVTGFLLLIAGIRMEAGLPALAALSLSPMLLYRGVLLVEILRKTPGLLIADPGTMTAVLKALMPASVMFMGIQCAAAVCSALPNLLVARSAGMAEVAEFSIVYRLFSMPLVLLAGVLPAFWPAFTAAWEKGDLGWLRRWLLGALAITAVMLSGYLLVMIAAGETLIHLWTLGEVRPTRPLLVVLGLWAVIQGAVHWLSTFLHSITDFRFELVSYGASALLLMVLGGVWAEAYGSHGVASAMAVSLLSGSLLPMARRVSRKLTPGQGGGRNVGQNR
ncbi:lipopolysaccharide biosynthesis protein [Desulfococcus sp.]|uniref:lipopolysaccharide biosynthesis protein n=1 Tax=Desulfococcus sp. TaxID=2025834 RepID=UPI003593B3BB